MTADVSAAERAYRRLKDDIQHSRLPTGPLDIRRLGDRLRMSATPVREALARLCAQQLVYLAPNHGYAVVFPSAHRLGQLYQLNGILIGLCLSGNVGQQAEEQGDVSGRLEETDYASRTTGLFALIAKRHPNMELRLRIAEMSDRLFAVRLCEPSVFPACEAEVEALADLWQNRRLQDLRTAIKRHHAARVRCAGRLAQSLAETAEQTA